MLTVRPDPFPSRTKTSAAASTSGSQCKHASCIKIMHLCIYRELCGEMYNLVISASHIEVQSNEVENSAITKAVECINVTSVLRRTLLKLALVRHAGDSEHGGSMRRGGGQCSF